MMIEGICEDLTGVQRAEVKVVQRQLLVDHDASVSADDIQRALAEGGYPVQQRLG